MTRGRQPRWATTPLATWIREKLNGKHKQWLIDALADRGKSPGAANRAVLRWTVQGDPPTAADLSKGYLVLLREIFGDVPSDSDAVLWMDAQARDLRAEVQREFEALRQELRDAGVLPPLHGDAPTRGPQR